MEAWRKRRRWRRQEIKVPCYFAFCSELAIYSDECFFNGRAAQRQSRTYFLGIDQGGGDMDPQFLVFHFGHLASLVLAKLILGRF